MTTFVKTACLCGSNKFKLAIPTADLPVKVPLCHCNTCRHSTGQACVAFVELNDGPLSVDASEERRIPANLDGLRGYNSSAIATRYFCPTCSAHMLVREHFEDGRVIWHATAGLLEAYDGIVKVTRNVWVVDTLDGGVSKHLASLGEDTLPSYKTFTETGDVLPSGWKAPIDAKEVKEHGALRFHCHCQKVVFYLTRTIEIKDSKEEFWHIAGETPFDPIRFAASYCFCNSCRLSGGALFQTWIFVPTVGSIFADAECATPVHLEDPLKRLPGLQQFESSPDVRREFCGTCGATAFYWNPGPNEPRMDIAHRLLDQDQAQGVLAEGWLAWGKVKMGSRGDSFCKDAPGDIENGIQSCGTVTHS